MAKTEEQLPWMMTSCVFRVGTWWVDPGLDQISRDGQVIKLEPRMMKLLVRLAQSPAQVISTQHLLSTVWSGVIVGPASVYQAISQLRKVLGDTDPTPTYIATIPRKGYRLVASVERGIESAACEAQRAPTTASALIAAERSATRLHWGIGALLALVVSASAALFVVRDSERAEEPKASPAQRVSLDDRTIAVLPLSAATQDEPTRTLAPIVTDLMRARLAALRNLVVIAEASTKHALQTERETRAVAEQLHARYLLRGHVARNGDRIRLEVSLLDVQTNAPVWSSVFDRPIVELAAVHDEIVRETAKSMQIALDPTTSTSASARAPVNLAAYQLYLRGRELMSNFRAADAKQASVMFSRVTTLDPSFARGYLAYGEALLLASDLKAWGMTEDLAAEAGTAFDRAIELNPALGEAWIQRARLTEDSTAAEALYRRGIQLAPGYDEGYLRYSDFLYGQRRRGEALELIDRARRIDPLSAPLCWRKGELLLATYGDVAGMQQLMREALIIKPDFPTALRYLGLSRALWNGEFAESIRLLEHAIAVDRGANDPVPLEVYLELDDPGAAIELLRDVPQPDHIVPKIHAVTIVQYQGDTKRAAEMARSALGDYLAQLSEAGSVRNDQRTYAVTQELMGLYWHEINALRDDAIATRDFGAALDLMGKSYELISGNSPMRNRGLVLTYAHTLLLAGETRRGRALLSSLLDHLDAEKIGRPANWYSWERAAAFAMLGDDERALEELAASVELGRFVGWWYTAERDPVFANIRSDPRFQALVAKTSAHRKQQRALLEAMRSKGEIPRRG